MNKKIQVLAMSILLTIGAMSSAHAIVGVGLHYGLDFSLSMDNVPSPGEYLSVGNGNLVSVSRTNFERSWINFGGKAYIDLIPFLPIDAIELSFNFGSWQYDGVLHVTSPIDNSIINIPLGVDDVGLSAIGVGGTPYAKMQFDLTLRRQLLNLIVFKLDAGLGYSMHLATPVLDADFVERVGGAYLPYLLDTNHPEHKRTIKYIVQEFQNESMSSVHGMHVLVGVKVKLPVMPIGFYVDGKYMIPFSDFYEGSNNKNISGFGLMLNAGVSLSI